MKKFSKIFVISYCFSFFFFQTIFAGTVVDKFKIEGIRTIASTKALQSELLKKLDIKILDLNLKSTDSGWPVLRIEYDPVAEEVENIMEEVIEDEPEVFVDDMVISDYWDAEGIKLIDQMHGNDVGLC